MLLIVEDSGIILMGYRNVLSSFRMSEGSDYIFAESFDEAKDLFLANREKIAAIIVDHNLIGPKTGLDVVKAIRSNPDNDQIKIVRCSSFCERGYPEGIGYFRKTSFREAVRSVSNASSFSHPCIIRD